MGSPATIPFGLPQAGEVLAGRYRVESVIGAGGMGVVVAASRLDGGGGVAVKFLTHGSAREPEAGERLIREARALASIRSEHVARVYEVGLLPNGAPFMVMEHLAGTDLGRLRRVHGTFPIADAVDAILQAGEAVAEAHALGIVHRDLKPANLFVVARPDRSLCVKVLDFGLSKVPAGKVLTMTGLVAGSPQYMAPEQMRSLKHVDERADIWSLGVILYYLLSGQRPFEGQSMPVVWANIVAGPPRSLCEIRPEVSSVLDDVVRRCLAREPEERVRDLAELAHGLAPFASTRGRTSVDWIRRALMGGPISGMPGSGPRSRAPGSRR